MKQSDSPIEEQLTFFDYLLAAAEEKRRKDRENETLEEFIHAMREALQEM